VLDYRGFNDCHLCFQCCQQRFQCHDLNEVSGFWVVQLCHLTWCSLGVGWGEWHHYPRGMITIWVWTVLLTIKWKVWIWRAYEDLFPLEAVWERLWKNLNNFWASRWCNVYPNLKGRKVFHEISQKGFSERQILCNSMVRCWPLQEITIERRQWAF
jgi:E3 ubiquitin-protein ligase DOA10